MMTQPSNSNEDDIFGLRKIKMYHAEDDMLQMKQKDFMKKAQMIEKAMDRLNHSSAR